MNRYCIFSAQFLPHMGGVERYTYYMAKELIKRGNQVVVVTNNTTNSPDYECIEEIQVYRFPCYPLIDGRFPVPKCDKVFRKINRILNKKEFDLVMINARFYLHSLYAARYAKKKGIPSICIEHGTSHLSVHNPILDNIGALYEHFHTWILKRYCKDYYGVSKACTKWSGHFHIKSKGVLYNSIDLNEIQELQSHIKPIYRDRYNIPKDATVITFTGRLLKEKGLPSLLNVVEKLCKEYKDLYLLIAGDGDMKEEIETRKSEHIIPLGRIGFEEIITLLTESDIFCLPSFSEGFSTSILEAAACKCYIVTTARGGAKELLINDEYGCVIPNNSEEVLCDALKNVIQDRDRRVRGAELAYERVEKDFTWAQAGDKVERIVKYC